jgi:hypothetical protein
MVNMRVWTQHNTRHVSWIYQTLILLVTLCMLSACTFSATPSPTQQSSTQPPSLTTPQETIITFRLTLNQPLPPGESVALTLLDEVSGLAFNPFDYVMTAEDATHYSVLIPFEMGTVLKYRYTRHGISNVIEHLPNGEPVRYRLYHVEGPGMVQDTLSRWTDTQFVGKTGRITGKITEFTSGQPIPNLLIASGGAQVFTNADGSYLIEGLPEGTHNLVAYALDGMYHIYQQGATIAADSTTPASFNLYRSETIPVIFTLTVPESTPSEAPLRLAGNLLQLGNTFADLSGGVSTIASRMPVLSRLPDGRFATTVNLPVGAYIEYKYTLGDGLWNAEHSSDGSLITRHFTVPGSSIQLTDTVSNWGTLKVAPIRFDVAVPVYTPANEGVSIQFNPGFGWLEPLPMWSALNAQGQPIWRFILLSPLEILGTIQYRICRAEQCGIADDRNTQGANPLGNIVNTGALPQTIVYSVSEWVWYPGAPQQASIPNVEILPRTPGFIAGICFDPSYHPSWGSHVFDAIAMVNNLGANWLILQPSWSLTRMDPPILEILPAQDILLPDLISYITRASSDGLNVGLYPSPRFPVHPDQWWYEAPRDFSWWVVWFDHYTQFILHHAELASQYNIGSLIIGGDWITPALPGGVVTDGNPSGVPADADSRWRNLISEIRDRYHGTLIWALSYPEGVQNAPPFISEVDKIILHWSAPLSEGENPSVTELSTEVARIFDNDIFPFSEAINMPIILAIEYPSANGSAAGCIPVNEDTCLPVDGLSTSNPDLDLVALDLQEQANLYNAVFMAVNERPWINGVISMGFYPPAPLQDPSISVFGKPASGVLWYWFPRFLGSQP